MEAGSLRRGPGVPGGLFLTRAAGRHPERAAAAIGGVLVVFLVALEGLHAVAQTGLNGLTLGSIYALGAVGLTLVYGILRLVNFAHGDFLTFGAYMASWRASPGGFRSSLRWCSQWL
jgi:neutral amino acid transport system permease protein